MESIPDNPILKVTKEELAKIREDYNLDVNKINDNIDLIEEWCQKQAHLQEALQYFDRDFFERIHILARGSVEATKTKIDKILTTRGLVSDIALNISINEFENLYDNAIFIALPNLSPRCLSRILIMQLVSDSLENFSYLQYIRFMCMVGDIRLHNGYSPYDRYIVDFKNVNVNIVTKVNPMLLRKGAILATEAFGLRIRGVHFVNTPPFAAKLAILIKSVFKEKLAKRIHIHKTFEDLHKEIPKEVLPKDYGGDGVSCAQVHEQWRKYLNTDKARKIIEISNKLMSDETKRSSTKFNEEYLGMPGTFKSLNVD